MAGKFDSWPEEAGEWRSKLLTALKKHDGDDMTVPYDVVARAFPSDRPHYFSRNFPRIDDEALIPWATENGWHVKLAPEVMPEEAKQTPDVRFTKL